MATLSSLTVSPAGTPHPGAEYLFSEYLLSEYLLAVYLLAMNLGRTSEGKGLWQPQTSSSMVTIEG